MNEFLSPGHAVEWLEAHHDEMSKIEVDAGSCLADSSACVALRDCARAVSGSTSWATVHMCLWHGAHRVVAVPVGERWYAAIPVGIRHMTVARESSPMHLTVILGVLPRASPSSIAIPSEVGCLDTQKQDGLHRVCWSATGPGLSWKEDGRRSSEAELLRELATGYLLAGLAQHARSPVDYPSLRALGQVAMATLPPSELEDLRAQYTQRMSDGAHPLTGYDRRHWDCIGRLLGAGPESVSFGALLDQRTAERGTGCWNPSLPNVYAVVDETLNDVDAMTGAFSEPGLRECWNLARMLSEGDQGE